MNPLLLDLFCGAGGVAAGYCRAGFDIVGVDLAPQPQYPFDFIEADALAVMDSLLTGGDVRGYRLRDISAIHSSPPCQLWAQATLGQRRSGKEYPDLLTPLRPRLAQVTVPWLIENVPGAPLRPDIRLCGCHFGLALPGVGYLKRERWVETSWAGFYMEPPHHHAGHAISIAGHGTPSWMRARTGHIGVAQWRAIMGIGWPMTREQLTEALPPAYGQYLGQVLAEHLDQLAA